MNAPISCLLQDTPASEGSGIVWVDILGLSIVGLFMLLGIWRGLWWQVIRLLGVIAAVGLARAFTPRFYPTIHDTFPEISEGVGQGIVWFGLFLSGLVIASLLGLLGRKALETMQLGLVDRVGGAVVGALTGILLHGAFMVGMVTLGSREWSSKTLEDTGSQVLLELLVQKAPLLLDSEAAERLLGPLPDAEKIIQLPDLKLPAELPESPKVK